VCQSQILVRLEILPCHLVLLNFAGTGRGPEDERRVVIARDRARAQERAVATGSNRASLKVQLAVDIEPVLKRLSKRYDFQFPTGEGYFDE
jgi:hypothetical protein